MCLPRAPLQAPILLPSCQSHNLQAVLFGTRVLGFVVSPSCASGHPGAPAPTGRAQACRFFLTPHPPESASTGFPSPTAASPVACCLLGPWGRCTCGMAPASRIGKEYGRLGFRQPRLMARAAGHLPGEEGLWRSSRWGRPAAGGVLSLARICQRGCQAPGWPREDLHTLGVPV